MTVTAPTPTRPPTVDGELWMFVPGKPAPQGSKNVYPNKRGGFTLVESSAGKLYVWRDTIVLMAQQAAKRQHWGLPATTTPLHTTLVFRLPRPRWSTLDKPTGRPDIDKLTRAVHDALTTARIWADDAQVTSSRQCKTWAWKDQLPGLIVVVRPAKASDIPTDELGTVTL